ncbi:MAG: NTP transferase domain-containing protein, partial [Mycobacteriaceae bacterium]|nr:NTP transferase domain-containing protein [Mycobacteriaceae bacterium]
MKIHRDIAVVLLAAGPGTRMRSDTPKVLHTLAGRSMLSHALHAIAKLTPAHAVVVLGHERDRIAPVVAELADTFGRSIEVAMQQQQRGTGDAVLCGLSVLPEHYNGPVVVTAGDIPLLDTATLAGLIATHADTSAAVTLLTTTLDDPTGYGRILRNQHSPDNQVMAIVEEADATATQRQIREVNAGVYVFDIAPLRSALARVHSDNAQQELYLTDVIAILTQDGQTVGAQHVADSTLVAGVNNRVQLAHLSAELNRRIVATHQLAGVTVVDPASTWIDIEVTIGRDTIIQPGTQLLGHTHIGGHCAVGPDTTLTDVIVGDGACVV